MDWQSNKNDKATKEREEDIESARGDSDTDSTQKRHHVWGKWKECPVTVALIIV